MLSYRSKPFRRAVDRCAASAKAGSEPLKWVTGQLRRSTSAYRFESIVRYAFQLVSRDGHEAAVDRFLALFPHFARSVHALLVAALDNGHVGLAKKLFSVGTADSVARRRPFFQLGTARLELLLIQLDPTDIDDFVEMSRLHFRIRETASRRLGRAAADLGLVEKLLLAVERWGCFLNDALVFAAGSQVPHALGMVETLAKTYPRLALSRGIGPAVRAGNLAVLLWLDGQMAHRRRQFHIAGAARSGNSNMLTTFLARAKELGRPSVRVVHAALRNACWAARAPKWTQQPSCLQTLLTHPDVGARYRDALDIEIQNGNLFRWLHDLSRKDLPAFQWFLKWRGLSPEAWLHFMDTRRFGYASSLCPLPVFRWWCAAIGPPFVERVTPVLFRTRHLAFARPSLKFYTTVLGLNVRPRRWRMRFGPMAAVMLRWAFKALFAVLDSDVRVRKRHRAAFFSE